GTTALVTVGLDGESGQVPTDVYDELIDVAESHAGGGLQIELAGDGIRSAQESEAAGGGAEGAGMLAALVILVFMFGSLLAATLPLITALFAVGSTLGLTVLASHVITIPNYTAPTLVLV